ncbi:MAG: substrate-binding domain-containing protein [Ruminococcus sp.]|nr:substrate-binding domain-containing protein [Ruminococcus sp.]
MKKHIILLSAIVLTFSAAAGCTQNSHHSESVQTSAKELVEIDPFDGTDFIYHHIEGGGVQELSYQAYFKAPEDIIVNNEKRTVQFYSDDLLKGLKKCRDLGFNLHVYRYVLDDDLQEGETVTLHLYTDDEGIAEEDIASHAEKKYGIKLTSTSKDITVRFEEDRITEIDPFENSSVEFVRSGNGFTVRAKFDASFDLANDHNFNYFIDSELVEGKDINDLYIGDKVRYYIARRESQPDNTIKEYKGKELNELLESRYIPYRFTKTAKVYTVMPSSSYSRYSSNVNVMLKRPDNWHQIISDKSRFDKYDFRIIDGSTATIHITAELTRQYCDVDDDLIEYYIDHNTTGPAYEKLIKGEDGKTLIIVTEPSDEELAMAAEHNVELEVTPVALDGFVFITHKDNPVDSLTVEQIQDIYSGVITNWKDVGGNDEEIIAYQREKNSGSQTAMENLVMAGRPMAKSPKSDTPIDAMGALIECVAEYRNKTCSIGYTFYYYMNNLYKNPDIKVLKINGVSPDNEHLLDKSSPFSSGYYAVTIKGGDKKAEEIKDYLISDEGQEIVKLAGYCPIR